MTVGAGKEGKMQNACAQQGPSWHRGLGWSASEKASNKRARISVRAVVSASVAAALTLGRVAWVVGDLYDVPRDQGAGQRAGVQIAGEHQLMRAAPRDGQ
jgi:hypothetical protein